MNKARLRPGFVIYNMDSLFNPHCETWLKNKFYYYKKISELDNVYYSSKYSMFVLVEYEHVLNALKTPEIYTSNLGNLIVENPSRFGNTLGASDEPTHGEYKNVVKNAYSKQFANVILPEISDFIEKEVSTNSCIDISKISIDIASLTVTKLLGLPEAEEIIFNTIKHIQYNAEQCVKYNTSQKGYKKLTDLIGKNLYNNTKSSLPGIYKEYSENTVNKKNISLFTGPTISGASSLAGALQFLVLDLYKQQKIEEILANISLIPNAVQESLRYNSTTGRFSRTIVKDVVIKNTKLPANSRVALCLDATARDQKIFNNPDQFSLTRDSYQHLAFGHGIHTCIALYLSKAVLEVFLLKLLNNYGNYEVVNEENLKYTITASGNNDMLANLVICKK